MKLHWYSIILLILWSSPNCVISQNLVYNPSFEEFTNDCNSVNFGAMQSSFTNLPKWYSLHSGTAFFNICANDPTLSYNIPRNTLGFQYPKTGNGYTGFIAYYYEGAGDFRGYLRGEFNDVLQMDSVYCVEYYLVLAEFGSNGAIMNVDAYLSDTIPAYPPWLPPELLLELPAQIRSKQILKDSINWMKVSDLYKARGGERYITIGNFMSRERTTKESWSQMPNHSTIVHYFLDDVSVAPAGVKAPTLGADTILCRNEMPYRLNAPDGYDSYLWSTGQTSQNIDVYNQGKYTLTCSLGDCGSLSDEIVITFDTPLLSLANEKTICRGDTATISATPGFAQYRWSNGDTTQILRTTLGGTYYLVTTDRCSTQLDSVKVMVDTIPTGIIKLGNDTTLCHNGKDYPILLSANTELPNYFWSNGDTTMQTKVDSRGIYKLRSNFSCGEVSDEIFVDVCPPVIDFPNAFTPNGDGLNDTFGPVQTNMFIQSLLIYNRWGKLVFEGITPGYQWDGNYLSKPAPSGLYAYRILYSPYDASGKLFTQNGCVVLIR
ncbi:hypothetical protein SDC9_21064 [bioreactor metagenome]|jgi:gliding motility-associated-like protein|uniref:Gliding motility-associated C-terminal domain-containing protein n=2 Tax=root TaxID=1 RepID=A0A644U8I6_9ZZZZ